MDVNALRMDINSCLTLFYFINDLFWCETFKSFSKWWQFSFCSWIWLAPPSYDISIWFRTIDWLTVHIWGLIHSEREYVMFLHICLSLLITRWQYLKPTNEYHNYHCLLIRLEAFFRLDLGNYSEQSKSEI